jgi:hypothetical protein
MHSHADAVRAAIASLQGTLQVASALMRSGRRVDLDGLDQEAARVCAALIALPDEQGKALCADLEVLLLEVDRVTASLEEPVARPPPPS